MALIILALVIVLAALFGAAYLSFNGRINREISGLLAAAKTGAPPIVVIEEMIGNLPAPVQRYMAYSGVVGKPIPRTVHLRQTGRIKLKAGSSWKKIEAEQYYSTVPPGFVWKACVPGRNLPLIVGRDAFVHGRGSMLITMLSLIRLVNAAGPEMDQGALMRYLSEMVWFPAAFLGKNITWKPVDDSSAEVSLTEGTQSVSGTLYFDSDGRPVSFIAQRYMGTGRGSELATWSTPMSGYAESEGLRLPLRAQAAWKLKEGDFEYIDLEITKLEYGQ